MKKLVLFVVMFALATLSACEGKEESGGSVHNSDLTGEQLYAQSCSGCHGSDLKKGYAPDLDQIGTKYSAEELEDIIVNGYKSMPNGILKGEDAKKVAEWLAGMK